MRLTTEGGSDHWRRHFRHPKIFVDGIEVRNVCELDTEAGYVERLMTGADGRLVHDGDAVKVERLRGDVRVVEAG